MQVTGSAPSAKSLAIGGVVLKEGHLLQVTRPYTSRLLCCGCQIARRRGNILYRSMGVRGVTAGGDAAVGSLTCETPTSGGHNLLNPAESRPRNAHVQPAVTGGNRPSDW